MLSSIGENNGNFDSNNKLLLSLPDALAMTGGGHNHFASELAGDALMPITTQNYSDKYKELERILSDEKKTNEEFKKYYKALKTDHTRLKSECLDLKSQMQGLIEDNRIMQDKYKAMFEKMQQELRRKQISIEELKHRELDELKLERLKEDLSQQIETPYKDIVRQLEQELQKLQHDFDEQVRTQAELKSALEYDKAHSQSFVDQMKLKHEMELNVIRKDRDILRKKMQDTNQMEMHRIKQISQENNQFRIKIKALIDENEEFREKIEHLGAHNNTLLRSHSKEVCDYTNKISLLQSENDSLKQQFENSVKETVVLKETLSNNIGRLHDFERKNIALKLSCEDMEHKFKRDTATVKLETIKERGEFNRIKEGLLNQIEELRAKLDIASESMQLQKRLLDEKECELTRAVNSVNEDNWNKINKLTNEKIEVESKFQLINNEYEFKLSALQLEKDKSDDKLKAYEKQREEILRENDKLRNLMSDAESLRSELEREQEKNCELHKKVHKTEVELSSNINLEQELTEMNIKLKTELSFRTHEVQKIKDQMQKVKDDYEISLSQLQAHNNAEKSNLQAKYAGIQKNLDYTNKKLATVLKLREKEKKQYQMYARAIKAKMESVNGQMKEIQFKERNMSQMVPIEAYNKLKCHLNMLAHKHQEFRENVLNDGNFVQYNNGPTKMLSSFADEQNAYRFMATKDKFSYSDENRTSKHVYEKSEFHNKLDEITNRMDILTSIQNEHLTSADEKALAQNQLVYDILEPKSSHLSKQDEEFSTPAEVVEENKSLNNSKTTPKQIEIKKLSLSTSSSSSSIRTLSKKREENQTSPPHAKTETKSAHEKKIESSSYEDDFVNSQNDDSSSS